MASHIGLTSVEAVDDFLDAFEESLSILERMPEVGSLRFMAHAKLNGVRVWPVQGFPNHLIFYRIVRDEAVVIRVLHAARDLEKILRDSE